VTQSGLIAIITSGRLIKRDAAQLLPQTGHQPAPEGPSSFLTARPQSIHGQLKMTTHRGFDLGEIDPWWTGWLIVDFSVDTLQKLIIAQIALLIDRIKFFTVSRAEAVQDKLVK
jgi:hypothetical protein